jgi:hypothetical protein
MANHHQGEVLDNGTMPNQRNQVILDWFAQLVEQSSPPIKLLLSRQKQMVPHQDHTRGHAPKIFHKLHMC